MRAITTELEAREFYRTSQYPMWRNLVHRRHSAWRRVLWTMRGAEGALLEAGCGVAPVSVYCAIRRPRWTYILYDVPGASLTFGTWRTARASSNPIEHDVEEIPRPDVITTLDVLEHLPHPLDSVRQWLRWLRPGGIWHWNFVSTEHTQLDLATPAQREETISYLRSALRTVYEMDGYVVGRKV